MLGSADVKPVGRYYRLVERSAGLFAVRSCRSLGKPVVVRNAQVTPATACSVVQGWLSADFQLLEPMALAGFKVATMRWLHGVGNLPSRSGALRQVAEGLGNKYLRMMEAFADAWLIMELSPVSGGASDRSELPFSLAQAIACADVSARGKHVPLEEMVPSHYLRDFSSSVK